MMGEIDEGYEADNEKERRVVKKRKRRKRRLSLTVEIDEDVGDLSSFKLVEISHCRGILNMRTLLYRRVPNLKSVTFNSVVNIVKYKVDNISKNTKRYFIKIK